MKCLWKYEEMSLRANSTAKEFSRVYRKECKQAVTQDSMSFRARPTAKEFGRINRKECRQAVAQDNIPANNATAN